MPRPKKKDKGGDTTKKNKKEEGAIRPYDSTTADANSGPNSSSSSQSHAAAQEFMNEFFNMARENNMEIPQQLQKFAPSQDKDTRQTLKEQQKKLNKHRNVLSKIEAKEKALTKDVERWESWVKEVKEALANEKTKHEERQASLKKDLEELRKEEEEAIRMSQEEEQMEEQEEDPMDGLAEILEGKTTNKKEEDVEARVLAMRQKLEKDFQIKLQQHKAQVEQQYIHMLTQRKADVINLEDEDPEMIQEQDENGTGQHAQGGAAVAMGAYGSRKARPRTETSPYTRKKLPEEMMSAEQMREQRMEQRMKRPPDPQAPAEGGDQVEEVKD